MESLCLFKRKGPQVVRIMLCMVLFGLVSPGFGQEIKRSALRQIEALTNEKLNRTPTQQKIDSRLLLLQKRAQGDPLFAQLPQFQTLSLNVTDAPILVDIAAEVSPELLLEIKALAGKVLNAHPRFKAIRAELPLEGIMALAANEAVTFIQVASELMTQATNRTEGDVAHRADTGRTNFGVDGTGVKVGVISDSVDALDDLLGCDLPNTVTVLPGQSGNPGTSEGTALMEIVHDMAPGAELFFATAKGGEAQFAQNILDLAAAGCTVIVDDALYFSEGVFQDSAVSQAAEAFIADGGIYITSAGNSGNLNSGNSGVWEGDYQPTALPVSLNGLGLSAHDFGAGNNSNLITADSPFFFTLQWADPLGDSDNDYDLYLLNNDLSAVIAASTSTQNGTQNPFEIISSGARDDLNARLVVVLVNGDERFIHVNSHRGRLEEGTDGQIFGHPGAENVFSMAAVNVATANGGAFVGGPANPVQFFSSDGPRRIFFNADGSPVNAASQPGFAGVPNSVVRQKPDFAAADGVSTATPGFNPFFGTSASAPHSAAIAALMQEFFTTNGQLDPNFSAGFLKDIFSSTALDIEEPGRDRDSGFGIIDTENALGESIFADGFESGDATSWTK